MVVVFKIRSPFKGVNASLSVVVNEASCKGVLETTTRVVPDRFTFLADTLKVLPLLFMSRLAPDKLPLNVPLYIFDVLLRDKDDVKDKASDIALVYTVFVIV